MYDKNQNFDYSHNPYRDLLPVQRWHYLTDFQIA